MTGSNRTSHRMSRRAFLIGGASAAAALGAYTLAGWIAEETYQPPSIDSAAPFDLSRRGAPTQPIAILVDPNSADSFGLYLGEVLRSEGLNAFQIENLTLIDAGYLTDFPIVLLPPAQLSPAQAVGLAEYVAQGGALMAMQPDAAIAPIFGIRPAEGTTSAGYLVARDGDRTPLQIHAEAAHYAPDGAAVIAELYHDRSTATGFPAITLFERERGRAVMFAYDLARNIALMRQGNPAAANQDRDGAEGNRANDLFVNWLDLDNIHIPQADRQARLFVKLIENVLRDRLPLPRLWYFPGAAHSLIVLTGDAHAAPAAFIEDTLQTAESFGGRATVYYSPPADDGALNQLRRLVARLPLFGWLAPDRDGRPTSEVVKDWRERGHEFGVHPYVEDGVDEGYVRFLRAFHRDGYAPASPTVRTHRILWSGWVETARVQAKRGFRMNVDYYHIGPAFRAADGSWPAGHFIGSGLPMKFVDERGQIIDVYQQPTQLADEHWLATTYRGWAGLDGEQAAQVARGLIERCLDGAYAAVTVQHHMDFKPTDQPDYQNAKRWLTGILDYARERGLPIWTTEHWLAFTDVRHDAALTGLHWDSTSATLSFMFEAPGAAVEPLSILIPATFDGRRLVDIRVDDQAVVGRIDRAHGQEYAWVTAAAESHRFLVNYEVVS